MLTGADGLSVQYDGAGGSGDDEESGSGDGTSSSQSSSTGASSTGTSGAGGSADVPPATTAYAPGVQIDQIVVYQGVARPVMANGAPAASSTPVIAGRPALMRVFYSTTGAFNGQPVTARLTIAGQSPIERTVSLSGSSSEGKMTSTVNFDVPAEQMNTGMSYRVDLLQDAAIGEDNSQARYPGEETSLDSLPVQNVGTLKIKLVPVSYDADGSGRLPETSASQVAAYADGFFAMYPVSKVDVQVRSQPLGWGSGISANGSGWSDLLDAIADLRSKDGADFDTYYFGIFTPTSSVGSFCGGGCVAGLGFVGGPSDDWSHAAIGLGYAGDMAVETAVHEVGHNHGRDHAPCGTSGDTSYPYDGASIGVYGYNLLSGKLYSPNEYVDMMSYCSPTWISDYNFSAIFKRVKLVTGGSFEVPQALMNLSYDRVRIAPDGSATWLSPIVLKRPPSGDAVSVAVDTTAGAEQATGHLIRYDHLEGGVLFVPPTIHPKLHGGLLKGTLPSGAFSLGL